jgi:hypothetical protein
MPSSLLSSVAKDAPGLSPWYQLPFIFIFLLLGTFATKDSVLMLCLVAILACLSALLSPSRPTGYGIQWKVMELPLCTWLTKGQSLTATPYIGPEYATNGSSVQTPSWNK